MLERKNRNERQGKQRKVLLKKVSSLFALSASCASAWFFVPRDWSAAGSPRPRLT